MPDPGCMLCLKALIELIDNNDPISGNINVKDTLTLTRLQRTALDDVIRLRDDFANLRAEVQVGMTQHPPRDLSCITPTQAVLRDLLQSERDCPTNNSNNGYKLSTDRSSMVDQSTASSPPSTASSPPSIARPRCLSLSCTIMSDR